jgi:hypothetical protein
VAVVLTITAPTRAMYQTATDLIDLDADPPPGLIVHTACEVGGEVLVTDVWQDQASIDTFFETRLGKAIAEAGFDPPPPTLRETFNVFTPA